MKVTTAVVLALVANCYGAPLDIGTGLDLTPGDITFWSRDILVGGQKIQVGLGWQGGKIAAGAKVLADVNGKQVPISAALSSNINSLKNRDWKDISYEIGANVEDTVAAVVTGGLNGNVNYQVNAKVPTPSGTGVNAIGASLTGSGSTNYLVGGVAVGKEVIQATMSLDGLNPSSFNIQLGADTK